MKDIYNGFLVAFLMYSRIPVKNVVWSKDTMKLALCFLPFIGLIISVLLYFWFKFSLTYDLSGGLFATGCIVIPVFVSGGIHLDGLLDTLDALSSNSEQKRMLEIMQDVHVGAFAVIGCCFYFISSYGLWNELYLKPQYKVIALSTFFISRVLSALMMLSLHSAKNTGLANTFKENSKTKTVKTILLSYLILYTIWIIIYFKAIGIVFSILLLVVFICFKKSFERKFGGITGDLCGYFLQLCELIILGYATLIGVIL